MTELSTEYLCVMQWYGLLYGYVQNTCSGMVYCMAEFRIPVCNAVVWFAVWLCSEYLCVMQWYGLLYGYVQNTCV